MIMLFRLLSLLVACLPDAISAEGVNLIPLIRPYTNVSMSSPWRNSSAEHAIDGREDTLPDTCFCCAGTSSGPSWWRLDLGAPYLIESVIFTGRSDTPNTKQSRGFSIYNDFSNASSNQQLLYKNNATTGYNFTITLNQPVVLQRLEISSPKILTICELKVFQSVQFIDLSHATATMSSEYKDPGNHVHYASYAIDGNETTQPDTCFCCAGANRAPSYWRLDLGKMYLVQGFVFIGRNDSNSAQSRQFSISNEFSNTPGSMPLIYQNNDTSGYRFTHYFFSQILMEKIQINSLTTLTVCEFKLVKAVCELGKFGDGCQSSCHCRTGASCDIITGECPGQMCAAGWKGLNCSLACDYGYFGDNCSSLCHCRDNGSCDRFTGSCMSGCASGWRSTNCSVPCAEGTYGLNCSKCGHCKSPSDCDRYSGDCHSGCQIGYSDKHCFTDDNLIQKIRSHVSAEIYPQYSNYVGTNAIDQNEQTDADVCMCCAGANRGPSWWRLDLGDQYSVDTIIFIGRSDIASEQSRGFTIYDEYGNLSKPHYVIYKNTNSSGYHFVKIFDPPIILQRLEINKTSTGQNGVLTVCEFKLLESKVCPVPYFDRHCRQECHCADQQKCKKKDGICQTPGCDPGWRGASCNIPCGYASFGPNCQFVCHCYADDTCDRFHGNCFSGICAPGWKGDNCSIPCESGWFGQNCSSQCHCLHDEPCDPVAGNCTLDLCSPGWQNKNCSTACESGKFGQNCSSLCHCLHDQHCDSVSGYCPSGVCSPGWLDKSCSTACSNNTYGQNCSSSCHCNNCHHISGSCNAEQCFSKWKGKYCNETVEALKQTDTSPETAVIIGPIVAVFILGAIAAVLILSRRHAMKKEADAPAYKFTDLQVSNPKQNRVVQNRLVPDSKPKIKENDFGIEEDVYYDLDEVGPSEALSVRQLWYHVKSMCNKEFGTADAEFESLRSLYGGKKIIISKTNTSDKKVKLMENDVSYYGDGNYLDGYDKSNKYIALKGPSTDSEANAFWEMVHQSNASLIVMLQDAKLKGKALQYWAAEGQSNYRDISIKTTKYTAIGDFIIREFDVVKEDKQKSISQIQYIGSLADDIPCDLLSFIQFWRKSASLAELTTGPIVVHCSSGDGMAGVYIALDILYTQAIKVGYVNPRQIIGQMWSQHPNIITTKWQYRFLYESLVEALHIPVKPVKANEFQSYVRSLTSDTAKAGQSWMVFQHELLFGDSSTYSDLRQGEREHDYSSLTQTNQRGQSKAAPPLPERHHHNEKPSLTFLQNYANRKSFILAPVEDKKSFDQLWKILDEIEAKTVICLDGDNLDLFTSPDGIYSVRLMDSRNEEGFIFNTYAYHRKQMFEAEVKSLKSFHCTDLNTEDPLSNNVELATSFVRAIHRWQPTITEVHPALLIYRFNDIRICILLVLLNEYERLRASGEINIIETAQRLIAENKLTVLNAAGYQFCHAAMLDLLNGSDTYVNINTNH